MVVQDLIDCDFLKWPISAGGRDLIVTASTEDETDDLGYGVGFAEIQRILDYPLMNIPLLLAEGPKKEYAYLFRWPGLSGIQFNHVDYFNEVIAPIMAIRLEKEAL